MDITDKIEKYLGEMATPSQKSSKMRSFLDKQTKSAFGRPRTGAIKKNICVKCGGPATEFEDELSKREYAISGLCQKCQDETF